MLEVAYPDELLLNVAYCSTLVIAVSPKLPVDLQESKMCIKCTLQYEHLATKGTLLNSRQCTAQHSYLGASRKDIIPVKDHIDGSCFTRG